MSEEASLSAPVLLGRRRRLDKRGILAFLRGVSVDRRGMLELRRLLAVELGRSSIHNLRDDVVLEMLAERYVRGALDLVLVHEAEPEFPGFPVQDGAAAAAPATENKAGDLKPAPIVPQEYPVLARVESDGVIDATLKLVAELTDLLFGAFVSEKRPSTLAQAYLGTSSETGDGVGSKVGDLLITLGLELHAFGPDKPRKPEVPDAYVLAANDVSRAPGAVVSGLGDSLLALAAVPMENKLKRDEARDDAKKDEAAEPEKTWLELCVVTDSGAPVSLELVVTTASGEEKKVTTGSDGKIKLDGLDAGSFSVRSDRGDKRRDATLKFDGVGGDPAAPSASADESKSYCIADIEEHRVATGETLASVAEQAGITWQELAMWSWGTDDLEKVDAFLRLEVGCTKRDAGGHYVFDDGDEPGVLLVPKPWVKEGLSGGTSFVIRVGRLVKETPWIFSM